MIHLLLGPSLDLVASRIACGARAATKATWDRALVTCAPCLALAREPCTCGPAVPQCAGCRGWRQATRAPEPAPPFPTPEELPRVYTERDFQEWIRQVACSGQWLYYHTTDSRRSPAGVPDCLLVRGSRCVWAELKMPKNPVTPAQRQWLEALAQVETTEAYLWRPGDMAQVLEVLR